MGQSLCASKKNIEKSLQRELDDVREKWRFQRVRQKRLVTKLEQLAEENKQQVVALTRENATLKEHKNAIDEELVNLYGKFNRMREMIN